MKYITIIFILVILACSKEDMPLPVKEATKPPTETTPPGDTTPGTETPENKAPELFELIDVPDGSEAIDLTPTFIWQPAVDPEGEAITYDLYLDDNQEPITLVAENLVEPNFSMTERLHLITDYNWKVVAKDAKDASISSATHSFTTRNLRFPDNPVTSIPGFLPREGFSMLVFQDKVWLLGGYDPIEGKNKNDVWNSTDGENWNKVSPDFPIKALPQFPPRSYHASIVFDDKMWVIAGNEGGTKTNDVWYSEDGSSWFEAISEAPFESREELSLESFDNKLWVIRGNRQADVWSSVDGTNWIQTATEAAFPEREYHSSAVFQDKLWIIGGDGQIGDKIKIWNSSNGADWQNYGQGDTFLTKYGHSSIVFDNKLYVIGGDYSGISSNEIRYTTDGIDWTILGPENALQEFNYPRTAVFKNKIWIIGEGSPDIWAID